MPRLTIEEAKAQGYMVDTTCYPHLGYKGRRFTPTETIEVLTSLEADLLAVCELGDFIGDEGPVLLETAADLVKGFAPVMAKELRRKAKAELEAITKARGERASD